MALPTPNNILVLNARAGATTNFIQEVSGVASTTFNSVVVDDLNPSGNGAPYLFAASFSVLTQKRLLVTVTCTPPSADKRVATTRIKVTVTTNAGADDTGPVPAILLTRHLPIVDPSNMPTPKLKSRPPAGGNPGGKTVFFLPIIGLGDIITGTATLDKGGTWTVVKATQLPRRVKITLRCDAVPVGFFAVSPPPTGCITIILTAEDGTTVEVPPMDVTYADDPDDDPD